MTVLVRTKKWKDIKPSGMVEIDWNNPLSQGLVGYWLINEGAGNVRDLVLGHDGVLTGASALWGVGPDGRIVNTPAGNTDYIDIPDTADHDIVFAITYGLLFTPRTLPFAAFGGIWRRGAATDASGGQNINWMLQGMGAASTLQAVMSSDVDNNDFIAASVDCVQDQRCYAVGTWDVDNKSITVDGVKNTAATDGTPTQIEGGATKTWIGRRNSDGPHADYHAAWVYDRVQNDGEIAALHEAPYQVIRPAKQVLYFDVTAAVALPVINLVMAPYTPT